MALFQDIVEHLDSISSRFSAYRWQICIHCDNNSVTLTFYKGGNQINKLEIQVAGHTIVTQTYGEQESWALYKQEVNRLVLFSQAGKMDILLS